jgi:hypothetical protein
MIIENTLLENILTSLLQKKITIEIEGKVIKTGKFILFNQKYFYIVFHLYNTSKKKQEKIDIPIPFNIKKEKDKIYFDYKLTTFAQNNKSVLEEIQKIKFAKNKFINKILTIHLSNEK